MVYGTRDSMPHLQGLSNNPYAETNQFNFSYYNYLFKVHSNFVLPSKRRCPKALFPIGLPVKILTALVTFFHYGYMTSPTLSSRFNHLDL